MIPPVPTKFGRCTESCCHYQPDRISFLHKTILKNSKKSQFKNHKTLIPQCFDSVKICAHHTRLTHYEVNTVSKFRFGKSRSLRSLLNSIQHEKNLREKSGQNSQTPSQLCFDNVKMVAHNHISIDQS